MSNVICLDVYKNTLKRTDGFNPVRGEGGYTQVKCRFKSGGDWDGIALVTGGFFADPANVITAAAAVSGGCAVFDIPSALLNAETVFFGITGSKTVANETVTIATNVVRLDVARGIIVPEQLGIGAYEQLLGAMNAALALKAAKTAEGDAGEIITAKADGDIQRSGKTFADEIGEGETDEVPTCAAVKAELDLKADAAATLAGYGITDAYTKTETDGFLSGKASTVGAGSSTEIITAKGSGDIQRSGKNIGASVSSGSENEIPTSKAVKTALDLKVDKVSGKGLSTNDFTTEEKNKLGGIEAQANKTVVDGALSSSSTNPVQNSVIKAALDLKLSKLSSGYANRVVMTMADGEVKRSDYSVTQYGSSISSSQTALLPTCSAVKAALDSKVDTESGKGLSTNDYTTAEKNKLAGIEAQANKTVVDSALSSSSENPVQNKVIKAALDLKVDKVSGKGLSTNDYTTAEKNKLAGMETAIYEALDQALSGDDSNVPALLLDNDNQSGHYKLYYVDSDEVKNELFDFTAWLNAKGYLPVVTVSSIDSCTGTDILYFVDRRNQTIAEAYYVFNVKGAGIWTQYRVWHELAVQMRRRVRGYDAGTTDPDDIYDDGEGTPWGPFEEWSALEDNYNKASAINNSNKTSTDIYTSVKAVVDYIAAQGFLTQHQDISGKVDKVSGKGLSTNDYTTAEKNKLAGIEAQANKTVVDSALSSSSTNPVQNKVIKAALDNAVPKQKVLTIPNGTTTITRDLVNQLCPDYDATAIEFNSSLEVIGDGAFAQFKILEEIHLPDSLTEIGDYAFWGCTALKTIEKNNYVSAFESVGEGAFEGCESLRYVNVYFWQSLPYVSKRMFYRAFCKYPLDQQFYWDMGLELGTNATGIRAGAFAFCDQLDWLVIPDTITTFDTTSINECYGLFDVIVLGTPQINLATISEFIPGNSCLRVFVKESNLSFFVSDLAWGQFYAAGQVQTIEDNLYYFRDKGVNLYPFGYYLNSIGNQDTLAKHNIGDAYTKTEVDTLLGNIDPLPTGGTVGQVLTKTAGGADWQNPASEGYEFVDAIPQNADTTKKYVLPDGYIYEWQDGSPAVTYNANTTEHTGADEFKNRQLNKSITPNQDYQSFSNANGVLTSGLIPFSADWQHSSSDSAAQKQIIRQRSTVTISGLQKIVSMQAGSYSNAIYITYYDSSGGWLVGMRSNQMDSINTATSADINLPLSFYIKDANTTVSSWSNVAYVRIQLGINAISAISASDVENLVINVPYYDTPATSGQWVSTGVKHPFYTMADEIFNMNTGQVLYAVGDSITYGYGVGGANYSWVKHVIDRNGYAPYGANGSKNLGESGLGFCTTSTSSHTITDVMSGTDFSGADIVTVALGINDWKNQSALLTDFWTGMEYCFNKIRTDNPYCKIYYILPFNATFLGTYSTFYCLGSTGDSNTQRPYAHKLQAFINMIKAKFEESTFKAFNVNVIDMTECEAINRHNIADSGVLIDSIHPSAETHAALGKEIARRIALT